MSDERLAIDTRLIHGGGQRDRVGGALVRPIFQSSVFAVGGPEGYADLKYPRYNNLPDQQGLAAKLAGLEGAEAALLTATGMAAISAALFSVLGAGDHLLAGDCLYGGTHKLIVERFPAFGIDYDLVPITDPDAWRAKLRPRTRAIYVETLTNPLLDVPELGEVVRFAREHGLVSMIDNTFATPVNFRPAERGFDLSLHSGTKYLNGHSDLVAGAVLGRGELVAKTEKTLRLLGGSLDPHACFLLHRGLKTLALRVRQQNATATALAGFLAGHPAVAAVRYPGLADDPAHERARRYLDGFGGMLAFEPAGGREAADRFLGRTRIATHAPSLGGVETLVVSPARSSHAGLSAEERRRAGIGDGLVRVSVGIEAADDLVADFDQALAS